MTEGGNYKNKQMNLKTNIQECIKHLRSTYCSETEVIKWWQDKGYSYQHAKKHANQTYDRILKSTERYVPFIKSHHLDIYNDIIRECKKDKDWGILLKAMERIEKIYGVEAAAINTQVNINNNTLSIPNEVMDLARQFLKDSGDKAIIDATVIDCISSASIAPSPKLLSVTAIDSIPTEISSSIS